MRAFSILLLALGCLGVSLSVGMFSAPAHAQANSRPDSHQSRDTRVEIANLRADIQVLDRRMREMALAMEDLQNANRKLHSELERMRQQVNRPNDGVSQGQLDRAISNLRQQFQSASSEQQRQILKDVTRQIEALGKQTKDALDTIARSSSGRSSGSSNSKPPPSFSDDFPKTGVSYTVKSGDTLSEVAAR